MVYKKLSNGWIAELKILGKTNEARKVHNKNFSKYRTSKAKVLRIFKKGRNGKITLKKRAGSGLRDKTFKYKTGEIIEVDDFNKNIKKVCTTGIHYFKSYEPAYMFNLNFSRYTGFHKQWHENGEKAVESNWVKGKLHGVYKEWYKNGKHSLEANLVNGVFHGKYIRYKGNGKFQRDYVNGKY